MRLVPWNTAPKLDAAWKRRVAVNMLDSLSEAKYVYMYLYRSEYMNNKLDQNFRIYTCKLKFNSCRDYCMLLTIPNHLDSQSTSQLK